MPRSSPLHLLDIIEGQALVSRMLAQIQSGAWPAAGVGHSVGEDGPLAATEFARRLIG